MSEARFQSFDDQTDAAAARPRLTALRAELENRGLDGFVLPRADAHQNEYVAPSEERLAWLTGFTGSAGFAVVLPSQALLFVDGRYTLQAQEQVDTSLIAIEHLVDSPPDRWLEKNLKPGVVVGYDPWLHTAEAADKLAKACASADARFVSVEANPVDAIWADRPASPLAPVTLHDLRYAGETAEAKLRRVADEIRKLRADALAVSDAHNVAWLFNIRGGDVAHTPLPLSFAIVPSDGRPSIYIDGRKLTNSVRARLETLADIREPAEFQTALAWLGAAKRSVWVDQATAAEALVSLITKAGGNAVRGPDPITLLKAQKNETEIEGTRAAHRRDGAAMVRFLAWFDHEARQGKLTEIDAVEKLESFRRETGPLKDVSFPSIAGAGANAASPHYRVTRKTNRKISPGELFLIDSGGQYEDGTTDITRTIAVGKPSTEMRERFTLVLRGHIAVATAVFPDGVSGAQLDTLARQFLWQHGLDFDHGTGHGVGSYLSVHEGPARISKLGTVPLKRGMILSNEPGYYKAGQYGIRIENLVLVTAASTPPGGEKSLNHFETLTLAPIDRRLIDPALMTQDEIAWLDAYHARVAATLGPLVESSDAAWLQQATRPLRAS
jgi:Xaa-Pro aminopeptidase